MWRPINYLSTRNLFCEWCSPILLRHHCQCLSGPGNGYVVNTPFFFHLRFVRGSSPSAVGNNDVREFEPFYLMGRDEDDAIAHEMVTPSFSNRFHEKFQNECNRNVSFSGFSGPLRPNIIEKSPPPICYGGSA